MEDQSTIKVHGVMINTTDPQRLAKFWAEILGVEVRHERQLNMVPGDPSRR